MKTLLLALSLLIAFPVQTAYADTASLSCPHCDCDCPKDCPCRESQGGNCPDDHCLEDCDCDKLKIASGGDIEIHDGMREAIQINENQLRGAGRISEPKPILVNGRWQWTGFTPTAQFYAGAEYIEIEVPEDWVMKEIDFSKLSYIPIIRQRDNSCWAQGASTAHTMRVNAAFGWLTEALGIRVSPQDYIDCSGMGTARSGGQLSLSHGTKNGAALLKDYEYVARDGDCREDVERHFKLDSAPMVRGKGGAFPNELEINYALHMIGPFEVCGSAGAMKSGGWVPSPGGGSTNHCYGHGGMRKGENYGQPPGWYHGMANSWGEGWGAEPAGWGWYRLTSTPGGSLKKQSIMTEIQAAIIKKLPVTMPKEPLDFSFETKEATVTVHIDPSDLALFTKDELIAKITEALDSLVLED